MSRASLWMAFSVAVVAGAVLVGCSKQQAAETPRIEDRTFALKPAMVPVRVGVMNGQLTDLTVTERVNADTGEVVYAPQLRGTLKLKNTSENQAIRLVSGNLTYLGKDGKPMTLAEGRTDTAMRFNAYSSDRMDPGQESVHQIDVPFPASALKDGALADLRLGVTYIPTPYREDSVTVPVAVATQG